MGPAAAGRSLLGMQVPKHGRLGVDDLPRNTTIAHRSKRFLNQILQMHGLAGLPAGAAHLFLNNASRRNALSLTVLRDLSAQLKKHLTSPSTGRLLTLPRFRPGLLKELESARGAKHARFRWLCDESEWRRERNGLARVLVLSSHGPVFSSGHDLREVSAMSSEERKVLFNTCAEVMSLIRQSPVPVVCAVQGLATAAGFQLAMACDITIARASTEFQLEHRASVHKPINGRLPSHPSRFGLPDVCDCAADASRPAWRRRRRGAQCRRSRIGRTSHGNGFSPGRNARTSASTGQVGILDAGGYHCWREGRRIPGGSRMGFRCDGSIASFLEK